MFAFLLMPIPVPIPIPGHIPIPIPLFMPMPMPIPVPPPIPNEVFGQFMAPNGAEGLVPVCAMSQLFMIFSLAEN